MTNISSGSSEVRIVHPDSTEKNPFQTKFGQIHDFVTRLAQEKNDQLTNKANGSVYNRQDILKYFQDLVQTAESTNSLIADGVIEDPKGALADLETNFDTAIAFVSNFLETVEQPADTVEAKRESVKEKFEKLETEVRKFKSAQRKLSPWRQSFTGKSKMEFIDLIAKLGQAADQMESGGIAIVRMQMGRIANLNLGEIERLQKILDETWMPYQNLPTEVLDWVSKNINVFPPNWPVNNLFD